MLLYGPPGCGKTLISQATAGEIRSNFISVALHQILDLYIGNSEKNLHQLFQLARDHAPAILFFDEVDALAADRKDLRESGMRTLINQFLAEMDGNVANNEGILILGATNAPWHLDPAFRRPGRFGWSRGTPQSGIGLDDRSFILGAGRNILVAHRWSSKTAHNSSCSSGHSPEKCMPIDAALLNSGQRGDFLSR